MAICQGWRARRQSPRYFDPAGAQQEHIFNDINRSIRVPLVSLRQTRSHQVEVILV